MHSILEKILGEKRKEVDSRRSLYPVKLLEKSPYYDTPVVSLKKYLGRADKVGIIAEIKRRSPSKGTFKEKISVEELSVGYMQAGASALSILTDQTFFGGSSEDLTTARRFNFCPILRKDFIFDEYQIIEARSIGADVILLIASALDQSGIKSLSGFAKSLGLEVLVEVHSEDELDRALVESVDLIGVNNRNLADFSVNTDLSFSLTEKIPDSFLKVSESGIEEPDLIVKLKKAGFHGFLIGEAFMKAPQPERACAKLISRVIACQQ